MSQALSTTLLEGAIASSTNVESTADCRITLMNLDHSPDSDLWVEIRSDTLVKNVYTSGMVHIYISTDAKVRNGTFNICCDPITPGHFQFADTINRSCKEFNSPVRMVILPEDRVPDKIITDGNPILFDHLFGPTDIYRDHLAAIQHPSPAAVTDQVLRFLGLGNMSIEEAKGYISHLQVISKRQAKLEESVQEERTETRMAEIEAGESSKKLKTDATVTLSLEAFDSILAEGMIHARKQIASKKKSMKGDGKAKVAAPSLKVGEEFPKVEDLERVGMALDNLMGQSAC